jgi:hypothetical protein
MINEAENDENFFVGITFLNETLSNFTYKLRFSHEPKNPGES